MDFQNRNKSPVDTADAGESPGNIFYNHTNEQGGSIVSAPQQKIGDIDQQADDSNPFPSTQSSRGKYIETHTHDTTIHTIVKPPVVHETIRPIEMTIINTNATLHHHVHHYVHRIQPVSATTD